MAKEAKQCLRALTAAQTHNGKDSEAGHKAADEALLSFLEELGYVGIAAAYRGVEKLYD